MRVKLKQAVFIPGTGYRLDKGKVFAASQVGNNREFKKYGYVALHYDHGKTTVLVRNEYIPTNKRGE
tara:strand:- start:79 stop:279 length:201 start_codon:yes stop_codon:yes gene_type:complete